MRHGWSPDLLHHALTTPARPSSDFDLNPEAAPPPTALRAAAVLVGFYADDGRLLLTKRASGLRHHPGQIALPGGKQDTGDADATATALREAREEVGLDHRAVQVLGEMPPHRTVTGFSVTPVLALIHGPFYPAPCAHEVAEAFTLPFAHVSNPARYQVEGRRWLGGWRKYHVAPFGPYYLWGATACIMLGLARRLAP